MFKIEFLSPDGQESVSGPVDQKVVIDFLPIVSRQAQHYVQT
jgi:hypothetical protein